MIDSWFRIVSFHNLQFPPLNIRPGLVNKQQTGCKVSEKKRKIKNKPEFKAHADMELSKGYIMDSGRHNVQFNVSNSPPFVKTNNVLGLNGNQAFSPPGLGLEQASIPRLAESKATIAAAAAERINELEKRRDTLNPEHQQGHYSFSPGQLINVCTVPIARQHKHPPFPEMKHLHK